MVYERDGKTHETTITPRYDKENDRYLFGFYGSGERTKGGPVKTLQYGVYEVKYWIASTLESLKMLVTGQVGINEMSGPVGIVKGVSDTYEAGASSRLVFRFCRNAQLDDSIICELRCDESSSASGIRWRKTGIFDYRSNPWKRG